MFISMFQKAYSNGKMLCPSPLDQYVLAATVFEFTWVSNYLISWETENGREGYLDRFYANIFNFCHGNHFLIMLTGYMLVMFVSYWTIGAFYTFVDLTQKPSWIAKYKIQTEKNSWPTVAQVKKCIRQVLINQCWIVPFLVAHYLLLSFFGGMEYEPKQLPGFWTIFTDQVVNSTLLEVFFYYTHRILHIPYFYKRFHKIHHEWVSPIAISFFYNHPFELIFGILFPFMAGSYVRHQHIMCGWIWTVTSIIIGMNEHSGYHLPIVPSTEFHDFHHLRIKENYGLVGLMDWIHGTEKLFRNTRVFDRHFTFWGSTPLSSAIPDLPQRENNNLAEKKMKAIHPNGI